MCSLCLESVHGEGDVARRLPVQPRRAVVVVVHLRVGRVRHHSVADASCKQVAY